MKKRFNKTKFFFLILCILYGFSVSAQNEYSFTRINDVSELNDGDYFIVVNELDSVVLAEWNNKTYFNSSKIVLNNGVAITKNEPTVLQAEKVSKYYYLKTPDGKYLSNAGTTSKNVIALKTEKDETSKATITITANYAIVKFDKNQKKALLYYLTTGFSCYDYSHCTESDRRIVLYKANSSIPTQKKETSVTFSPTTLTICKGDNYTLPTATVKLSDGSALTDAQLLYSSSDETVATVNSATGELTLNNYGTTTIKAKFEETDNYKGSEGSYKLTFKESLGEPSIVFSAENDAFYALPRDKELSSTDKSWRDVDFTADNGDKYTFRTKTCYKARISQAYLTNYSGGVEIIKSPQFDAPNGYTVRLTFYQKSSVTRPYINTRDVSVCKKIGAGLTNYGQEYELIATIADSSPFILNSPAVMHLNKMEIFINQVNSLDISETDSNNEEYFKENEGKTVQFKLKRTFINDGNWYTICLPFDVSSEQLKQTFGNDNVTLRKLYYVEGTTLYFCKVDDIKAGVPYLINPNADIDEVVFENVKIDMTSNPSLQNGDKGYIMQGVYKPTALSLDKTNIYLTNNNQFRLPSEVNHIMNATRAFFIVPKSEIGKAMTYDTESENVNSIGSVQTDNIDNDNRVFNINGQYVGNSLNDIMPGIYIVDGKKISISNR